MTELEHTGKAQHELDHTVQSTKTLLTASAFAVLLAAIIFVVAILPAEFGIDPTGLGSAMKLTQLAGQTPSAQGATARPALPYREDIVDITIPGGKGLEYKFYLGDGDVLGYDWSTNSGEVIYFDFHGEPQGDTIGYFESYAVSKANSVRGTFNAYFEGSHGWYWENKGETDIVVTLKTQGSYKIIGLK